MPDIAFNSNSLLSTYLIPLAWKLAGALAMWIVGGWVINLIGNSQTAA